MEIIDAGSQSGAALPPTPANLDAVLAGKLLLRQRPGPKNALGPAKFIFPNDENVYMHGTPARQLFSRARRDLSHGCIRVEDPVRLAEWLLRDDRTWTRDRILAAMGGAMPTQVNLKRTLTVMIFYDTVYVDSTGVVNFADDYYGHDAEARGGPGPRLPVSAGALTRQARSTHPARSQVEPGVVRPPGAPSTGTARARTRAGSRARRATCVRPASP